MFIFANLLVASGLCPGQTIDDFFDAISLQDIRLTMSDADWQNVHDHYTDKKKYYNCDFQWQGVVVPQAALHTRGSGSLNPIKPGLGIEFGANAAGQTFLGLQSLVLRNFVEDPSSMHEHLTMRTMARMGLPYLRTVFIRLFVNGVYVGLYQVSEPYDTRFLKTRFGEDIGFLFEGQGGGGYHFQYLGEDPSHYVDALFNPKTHKDDPQTQVLIDMIRTANQASDGGFVQAMSKYMDLGAFAAYVAAEIFLVETDGILSDSGMANFYLYRRAVDDHWFFLPWDKEMTFGPADWPIWKYTQDNVLLRRALQVPELRQRYLDTLHLAAEVTGGSNGWLAQEIERVYNQIRQAMLDDPSRVCIVDGAQAKCPAAMFEVAVQFLRDFARARADFVTQSLLDAGWTHAAGAPNLPAGAASNAASGIAFLSPGEQVAVQADLPLSTRTTASGWPLPEELRGVSVMVSGVKAPLISVSPTGALLQTPSQLPCGPSSLAVTVSGIASETIPVELRPANPGIFVAAHADGSVVNTASPATKGEIVVLWVTGLGAAESDDSSGQAAPAQRLVVMKNPVSAVVDGVPAGVQWAGLAPGFAALQVVILRLPDELTGGKAIVKLSMFGETGPGYALAVR
ncbi:MAG: CotH kinase family protein [Bryobacterales bacterium]|nr:CotH kinase family protein [Bryobacterales bacterium]